jgi:hypothetical protein
MAAGENALDIPMLPEIWQQHLLCDSALEGQKQRSKQITNWVALLLHIWGIRPSQLWSFMLSFSPSSQITAHYLTLGHNHFLPHIFQFSDHTILFQLLSASLHTESTAEGSPLLVTGLQVHFQDGTVIFSALHSSQTGSGVHPAIYPMGSSDSFTDSKQPRSGTNHSPTSAGEFMNAWSFTCIPPHIFMA